MSTYVKVAQITKSHGMKGEVVVVPTNGLPFVLEEGMHTCLVPPQLEYDRFGTVESIAPFQAGYLVKFSQLSSIEDAQLAAPGSVLVHKEDVTAHEEFFFSPYELLDRTVFDKRYGALGSIVEVIETPANDVWVVDGSAYGEVLIPVIEDVILDVPDEGDIQVALLPGLIDSEPPADMQEDEGEQ